MATKILGSFSLNVLLAFHRNREMDRPRSRGDGAGSPGDVPRVRKFEEPKAPVSVIHWFSFYV